MVIPKKYWFPMLYGIAIVFFGAGLTVWLLAHVYQPVIPPPAPAEHYNLGKNLAVYPLNRYQALLSGRLFFGGSDLSFNNTAAIPVQFHSRLILWGVISDGHAVIGFDPGSNRNTKLVKVGDSIEGETIVAIGDGYITVNNQTGQGKIKIYGD